MSLTVTQALWSPDDHGVVFVGWWNKPFHLGLNACSNRRWVPASNQQHAGCPCSISTVRVQPDPLFPPRSGIFHLDLASGCCGERWGPGACPGGPWDADSLLPTELLSAENASVCSPRLSPDGQRLLYLEGAVGGPHRQCLRLCMVSWASQAPGTTVPTCAASTVPSPRVTAFLSAWLGWGLP